MLKCMLVMVFSFLQSIVTKESSGRIQILPWAILLAFLRCMDIQIIVVVYSLRVCHKMTVN